MRGRSSSSSHTSTRRNNRRRGSPNNNGGGGSNNNSMDKPILTALAALVGVYTVITVLTYLKVSSSNVLEQQQQQHAVSIASSSNKKQQQQVVDYIQQLQQTFPIHVGDDTEVIPHPGLALIDRKNIIPQGLPTTMTVPKFFDESHGHYYFDNVKSKNHTVRQYLGQGEQLITPEQAANIGSKIKSNSNDNELLLETIYCSVASYRDPECTGTVEDLYARADHPERIRVAILDQRIADGDPICSQPAVPCETDPQQALCQYRHLIDVYEMDARLAVGPVFARHLAHRHYRGEYFAMQIDSHVRFVEHWDSDIVAQWKSAHNEMAVLSTYLSDIIGSIDPVTHAGIHNGRPIMCVSDYEGTGANKHLRHGQQPEGPAGITGQPTLHPFWAAGFSFARGHFVISVPYDQYLPMVFQGEEISIGLRGFTYGYDYYAAERSVCFHMYAIKENQAKRKKVPLFWENSHVYSGTGVRAMKRLNSIIHMADHYPANEWDQDEIHKYGLGKVRDVEKFFKVFGIHVKEQTVEHHLCRFVGKPMMRTFLPALRANHMGIDYDKINYEFKDPAPEVEKQRKI